ncbi:PDDEXK nuclease domain-containing protein [Duganella lactea]|uniref:PDDEXK nuclease domain-containing protein n=1 Tax=Duganella lactea TaxID=2692173 RepID=UPI001E442C7A|nr:PDDEXK nuclease domain-containing protein [Duganella lactea]
MRRQIERKAYERRLIAGAEVPRVQESSSAGIFKDPYFLDFLGLRDGDDEADLEFFQRRLRRLVAIELKLGRFKAAHKGQMELYLRWLDKFERQSGEESPIGLILCAESSHEQVELLQMHKDGITVAEYWTELPPKAELERQLRVALAEARERLQRRRIS